jgi:superfamily II DNA or RNA helicase
VNPRPYQAACVQAVLAGFLRHHSLLAVLATGLGKTVIGACLIAEWVRRAMQGRVLWLAHREELIDQAAESIRRITGLHLSVEKAESYADEFGFAPSPIVVAPICRGKPSESCQVCQGLPYVTRAAWERVPEKQRLGID